MSRPRRFAAGRPSRRLSPQGAYLILAVVAVLYVAMMTYSYTGADRYLARHAPLADAAMEIRLEATTGYLWFEERLGGLRQVSLDEVLAHFARADAYAAAMLHGGAGPTGPILPLADPELRREIGKVRELLSEFRSLTLRRDRNRREAAPGSPTDRHEHVLFFAFSTLADGVEKAIQARMEKEARTFRTTQVSLLGVTLVAALLAGLALHRGERSHREQLQAVERERRAAEESEGRFRNLFEHSNDAVFLHDGEGRILRANERASEMLGVPPDRLPAMTMADLHPDDELADYRDALATLAARGAARFDSRLHGPDGATLSVDVSARVVDPAGGVVQSIVRDVTERRQLLEELRRTLDFLETLLDTLPNPVFHKDLDGVYRGCNRAFAEQILGLSPDAIVGRTLFDLPQAIPRELAEIYREADRSLFENPGRQAYEAPVRCADGARREFLFCKATYPDEKGQVAGLVGVMIDITEHKQAERALQQARDDLERRVQTRTAELSAANRRLLAEVEERRRAQEALRESEQKYSSLVENSPVGVFIYQDDTLVFVNRQLAEILGYSRDELTGLTGDRVIHPEDWPRARRIARDRLVGADVAKQYEIRALSKGGDVLWIGMNNTLIEYRGRPATLGNAIDITARKRAEEALAESEQERRGLAARLVSAQEQERGRIARELHDGIGQSLSALKFMVENLAAAGEASSPRSDGAPLRSLVPKIQATVEEVRRISLALRPSMLDDLGLGPTIRWLCREFLEAHPDVELRRDVSVTEDRVPDDLRTVVFRVLQEALNNVARHSRAGRVRVTVRSGGGSLELLVEDDGVGFDPAAPARGPERAERGFGLGNMRERTELSGGRFFLESASGRGTRVRARWTLDAG